MADTPIVYIVDDDAPFARGLARLVGAAGWSVRVFPSGSEFLDGVDATQAGCVILDVQMPGMKGPEIYRAMLQRDLRLPVIFLTGHGDIATSVDAMKLGAVDFLEKPVRRERLEATIREALARGERERQKTRARAEVQSRAQRLSRREREVMAHVISGRLNKQIAAELGISLKTVKAHRARVMQKMQAHSVAELVTLCRAAGIAARPPLPLT